MKMNFKPLVFCLAILPALCAAQDNNNCVRQFEAEKMRVERDMAKQRPAPGDKEAELRWSKSLHSAMALAVANAEQCRRAIKPAPAVVQSEEMCVTRIRQAGNELQKRYRGRTLSVAEQQARRTEEMRLNDDMQTCLKARYKRP